MIKCDESPVRLISRTGYSATILLADADTYYWQKRTISWRLLIGSEQLIDQGDADTATVFLENLKPDTRYTLESSLGRVQFTTRSCTGLLDLEYAGLSQDGPDNAALIQKAIDETRPGGTIKLPIGRFFSRPVFLKSDITLWIPQGSSLCALADRHGWPQLPALDDRGQVVGSWEGLPEKSYAALITAIECQDLSITGRGVIDGGGEQGDWWNWAKGTREGARRARTVYLVRGRNIDMSGFTVQNSPSWTVHPYQCRDLSLSSIRILNPPDSPNTDGFNPESCEQVTALGLYISVGDDCIAIKSGKRSKDQVDHLLPCRQIHISHCCMADGHGAVVLGSEMSGDITQVTVNKCELKSTDRGLRIKTRRGRGGRVSDVRFEQVMMNKVPAPFVINAFYFCDADGRSSWVQSRELAAVDETTPSVSNITFRQVEAADVASAAVAIEGLPESPITEVFLEDYRISFDPVAEPEAPLMACGIPAMRHETMFVQNASVNGEVTVLNDSSSKG